MSTKSEELAALLLKSMIKDPTEIPVKSRQNVHAAANVLTAVETTIVATVKTNGGRRKRKLQA